MIKTATFIALLLCASVMGATLETVRRGMMMDFISIPGLTSGTLGDGLVAHYKMNDTNATTLIDSKAGHTGTGTYSSVTGLVNLAANFSSQYVGAMLAIPTSYSMCFWANANPPAHTLYTAISKDSGGARSLIVFLNGDNDSVNWCQFNAAGSYFQVNTPTLNLTGWVHIIGCWDAANTNLTIYTNGARAASGVISGNALEVPSLKFDIGYEGYPGYPRYYNGKIDDLRIYNRVLTDSERQQLYNGGAGTEDE
jgi:hypothetical protein